MSVPLRSEQHSIWVSAGGQVEKLCDELNREIEEDKKSGKGLYSDLYHLPSVPREEEKDYVRRAVEQFELWIEDPKKASDALSLLQGTVYERCKTLSKEHAASWKIAMKVKLYRNWKKAQKAEIRKNSKNRKEEK